MTIDSILIFEPERVDSLYPFSVLHSSWEVRCGALKLFEKVENYFPDSRIIYSGREKHLASFLARFEHDSQEMKRDSILILHSAILPERVFFDNIIKAYNKFLLENKKDKSVVFTVNKTPVAAYVPKNDRINPAEGDKQLLPKFLNDFSGALVALEIPQPNPINYLWDAIALNQLALIDDAYYYENTADFIELKKLAVSFLNEKNIKIGKKNIIAPGVVIDASQGPVITGENVRIMPNAVIIGPCYIGDNSVIKVGAKIYKNTSIGEHCKVGGEVEDSIIHAYSNKQHEGFLGHSYLGEWVNIGADTNTSDLKNTYTNIKVMLKGSPIDTGRMFLGLLCGDHTKTAINTTFTTGTIAGICGIIVADGFLPNEIPPFAWRGTKGCSTYKLDKAIEVAKIVMNRRNKKLSDEEIELMKIEFGKLQLIK